MSRITLEDAYEKNLAAKSTLTAKQAALDAANAAAREAATALADATAAAGLAGTVLAAVATAIPANQVAQTTDGKLLIVFGGTLQTFDLVSAATITGEDGQPEPAPGPGPEPTPMPPAPLPFPEN